MDENSLARNSQNGDLSNKDALTSIGGSCDENEVEIIPCSDSNVIDNDLGDSNSDHHRTVAEHVTNVSKGNSFTDSEPPERVPKIFICSENCEPAIDRAETSVPSVYACCTSGEPVTPTIEECNGGERRNNIVPNENPVEENLKETPEGTIACENETQAAQLPQTKAMEIEEDLESTLNGKENTISPERETTTQAGKSDMSHDIEDQAVSKPVCDSSTSSAPHTSKFSFFRSIQNILIATKWSRLRHSNAKHQKHQPNIGGQNTRDEQSLQQLSKPERQRKISQRSQPGDLIRNQSQDSNKGNENVNPEDDADAFNRTLHHGQEGLDFLETSSRFAKDRGASPSKGHHFSLFKRHNAAESQIPSPPPSPPPDLTQEQKAMLKSSWAEIGDSVGQVGVIAFIGLFETHPDVKDSFSQFRGMSLDSVFTSISLKEHALRVMTTVEKFLNRIDRPEKLQKILEDLGKRHVAYRFKSEYVKVVGMQFIGAMKPHVTSWTDETEQAWIGLVDIMTFHIERGAFAEQQQQQQQSNC